MKKIEEEVKEIGKKIKKIPKLSLWQKIQLKINGYVFLGYEKRELWTTYLPIYLVKCKEHGLFEDYPHGKERFDCPECLEEKKRIFSKAAKSRIFSLSLKIFLVFCIIKLVLKR